MLEGMRSNPTCAYVFFKDFGIVPTMRSYVAYFLNNGLFMACLKSA
jgi:hypothetical protein